MVENQFQMDKSLQKSRLKKIVVLHEELKSLFKIGVEKAIQIGDILVMVKKDVEHGHWQRWMKSELPFSVRMAQRYMELYHNRHLFKNDTMSFLDFKSAKEQIKQQKILIAKEVEEKLPVEKKVKVSVTDAEVSFPIPDLKKPKKRSRKPLPNVVEFVFKLESDADNMKHRLIELGTEMPELVSRGRLLGRLIPAIEHLSETIKKIVGDYKKEKKAR